jgi:membrane protease YdiL (CAAX protease family)
LNLLESIAAAAIAHAPVTSALVLLMGGVALNASRTRTRLLENWKQQLGTMRRYPVLAGDAEILLGMFLLPNLVGAIQALSHGLRPMPDPTALQLLLGTLVLHGCLVAGIGLVWMRHPDDRRELFGIQRLRPTHDLFQGVVLLLRAYPYLILIAGVVLLLQKWGLPTPPQQAVTLLKASDTPAWMRLFLIGTATLTAPILEETIFRGILLPAVLKTRSAWSAIAIVSLLFAVAHMNVTSLPPLLLLGSLLAIAYIRTGSLLVPITMHVTFNAIQILIILQMPAPA